MTKRMLIDASHAEETRVVVLDGNRLEDFDVETSTKKQLKGNIYLAKVVRVEPSLQAAFVEYGGGRHGFLAFSEIHPDYYQIPIADRQRLLEMQAAEEDEEDEDEEDATVPASPPPATRGHGRGRKASAPVAPPQPEEGAPEEMAPGDVAPEEAVPEAVSPEPLLSEPAPAESAPIAPEPAAPVASEAAPSVPAPDEPELPFAKDAASVRAAAPEAPVAEEGPEGGEGKPPRAQPASIPEDVKYGEPVADAPAADPAPAAPEAPQAAAAEPAVAEPVAAEPEAVPETEAAEPVSSEEASASGEPAGEEADAEDVADEESEPEAAPPETINGEADTTEEVRARRTSRFLRNYRIQEVIKRRQILLVQVVKEERGTKGAALTTYISLAGRFCVLMPNSPRGGGISRKITSAADRKRLREITTELQIPRGMGLIVRTAGANRPKGEIKRDCEYLMRLWDDIRDHTMQSVAPALIYEEASLIKRAIRDVYSRDIDEIVVDGEEGWKAAHDFMRMLMPAHARKVQMWRPQDYSGQSLFGRYQVEAQLDAMLLPNAQLKSGGYLVINQTEALVAIDVNSGRSTRERGIEETALRTNLEAAEEVARQLRLRDLAGLIVIDFIDMEAKKNNAAVERRLKEALRGDRARIQVGHISHFGLMEMSRQRLRPSLTETSFVVCPHCQGLGLVRTIESSALHILRDIEDEGAKGRASLVQVAAASSVILYILNHKREQLALIERRSGMHVEFVTDETLVPPQIHLERLRAMTEADRPAPVTPDAPKVVPVAEPVGVSAELEDALEEALTEAGAVTADESATAETRPSEGGEEGGHRRRRRRRRRSGGREASESASGEPLDGAAGDSNDAGSSDSGSSDSGEAAGVAVSEREAVSIAGEQPAIPPGAFPVVPEPTVPMTPAAEAPDAAEPAAEAGAARPDAAVPGEEPVSGDEDQPRRRRGRRGGRRRRRDEPAAGGEAEAEVEAPVPTQVVEVPIWNGPTPADPFGQPFDIFDLMDQQEQAHVRVPAVPDVAPAEAAPAPVKTQPTKVQPTEVQPVEPTDAGATVPAEPEASQPEQLPVTDVSEPAATAPEPTPAEPAAPAEPVATEPVAGEPVAGEKADEARLEPVVGPAIKPVVLGEAPLPTSERKRGWWRR